MRTRRKNREIGTDEGGREQMEKRDKERKGGKTERKMNREIGREKGGRGERVREKK